MTLSLSVSVSMPSSSRFVSDVVGCGSDMAWVCWLCGVHKVIIGFGLVGVWLESPYKNWLSLVPGEFLVWVDVRTSGGGVRLCIRFWVRFLVLDSCLVKGGDVLNGLGLELLCIVLVLFFLQVLLQRLRICIAIHSWCCLYGLLLLECPTYVYQGWGWLTL